MEDPHLKLNLPGVPSHQPTDVFSLFTSPSRSHKGIFESDSRITVLQLANEEANILTYVFRQNALVSILDDHSPSSVLKRPKTVEWDKWGPIHSRLLPVALDQIEDSS